MTRSEAKQISQENVYTRQDLYDILDAALLAYDANHEYWTEQNLVDMSLDNGAHYNWCVSLLDYQLGINDNEVAPIDIVFRVLEQYGEYSLIQISEQKKKDKLPKIKKSEKPKLK